MEEGVCKNSKDVNGKYERWHGWHSSPDECLSVLTSCCSLSFAWHNIPISLFTIKTLFSSVWQSPDKKESTTSTAVVTREEGKWLREQCLPTSKYIIAAQFLHTMMAEPVADSLTLT